MNEKQHERCLRQLNYWENASKSCIILLIVNVLVIDPFEINWKQVIVIKEDFKGVLKRSVV